MASSSSKPGKKLNHGSLSSIVANLTRASYGASIEKDVKDEDLDRHVAELLLKEAKERERQAVVRGLGAYLDDSDDASSDGPKRKPNKRFLTSMLKNVDGHNKALLRAEAEAAAKRDQDERDSAEDLRAEQRRKMARLMGTGAGVQVRHRDRERTGDKRADRSEREGSGRSERVRSQSQERERERRRRDREYSYGDEVRETDSAEASTSSRKGKDRSDSRRERDEDHRERSKVGDEDRERRSEKQSDSSRSHRRRRSRTPDDGHRSKRRRSESPSSAGEGDRRRRRSRSRERRDELRRAEGSSHRRSGVELGTDLLSEETSVGLEANNNNNEAIPSKMDKYFSETYDPRLDVSVPDLTDSTTGLIADSAAFDGWNTMLHVIREQKEAKKERELREKEARREERARIRAEREERKTGKKAPGATSSGGLLAVEGYAKAGGTREWDMGKVEPF